MALHRFHVKYIGQNCCKSSLHLLAGKRVLMAQKITDAAAADKTPPCPASRVFLAAPQPRFQTACFSDGLRFTFFYRLPRRLPR